MSLFSLVIIREPVLLFNWNFHLDHLSATVHWGGWGIYSLTKKRTSISVLTFTSNRNTFHRASAGTVLFITLFSWKKRNERKKSMVRGGEQEKEKKMERERGRDREGKGGLCSLCVSEQQD